MNISRLIIPYLLSLLFCILFASTSFSQVEHHEIYEESSFEYEYHSYLWSNLPRTHPKNGNASIDNKFGNIKLTYTPDADFLGTDTILVKYWPTWGRFSTLVLVVEVKPHIVEANDDSVSTEINQSVSIDVFENDVFTRGGTSITAISNISSGSASEQGGNIVFVPQTNFEGSVEMSYTACDAKGHCDDAIVFVDVVRPSNVDTDTLKLYVTENNSLPVMVANESFFVEDDAKHGTLIHSVANEFIYTPDLDFIGTDFFTFYGQLANGGLIKVFEVEVVEKEDPNIFAYDDQVITRVNQGISFNVLENDEISDFQISSVSTVTDGTLIDNGNGDFTFNPGFGFTGIASFTYTLGNDEYENYESASVYIIVGNFNPASESFFLTTPKNTPRVLNYDIPILDFDFNIIESSNNGQLQFHKGFSSLSLLGQFVEGDNLLIYSPAEDFTGTDEFKIEYCVGQACQEFTILMNVIDVGTDEDVFCVFDCVWPGDANDDGIVSMNDLLALGIAMGEQGVARDNAHLMWYGQFAPEWSKSLRKSQINLKHADTDGDGSISAHDTTAITKFYGLTHDLIPETYSTVKEVPIFLVPQTDVAVPGGEYIIDIYLGEEQNLATDIYGFTFSLPYNTKLVVEGSMSISFDENSWVTYGSPTLQLDHEPWPGTIDAGFTRTNGISSTGFGKIGEVGFIVEDDLAGIRLKGKPTINFEIAAVGTNAAGDYQKLLSHGLSIPLELNSATLEDSNLLFTENHISVYPNPAKDFVNIEVLGKSQIEKFEVFNLTGQMIYQNDNVILNRQMLPIADYSNGMYFLRITTDAGIQTKKFEVLR